MEPMQSQADILAVDDNREILEILRVLLAGEGYRIVTAESGEEALKQLRQQSYDLIILDVMMPGLSGYETCQAIRQQSNAPILFLSARSSDSDKTMGFSSGGDDYLQKPFSYPELLGRVKALLRRYRVYQGKQTAEPEQPEAIQIGQLEIIPRKQQVRLGETEIDLTGTEFSVLHLLASHRQRIFSAQEIFQQVWQEPYYRGASNTVMVHIRNLRRKLEPAPEKPIYIKTAWGRGYYCE